MKIMLYCQVLSGIYTRFLRINNSSVVFDKILLIVLKRWTRVNEEPQLLKHQM